MFKLCMEGALLVALIGPATAAPMTPAQCAAAEQNLRRMSDLALNLRTTLKTPEFQGMVARSDGPTKQKILDLIGAQSEATDALLKLGIAAGLVATDMQRCAP